VGIYFKHEIFLSNSELPNETPRKRLAAMIGIIYSRFCAGFPDDLAWLRGRAIIVVALGAMFLSFHQVVRGVV
jgi:hypothetical protein